MENLYKNPLELPAITGDDLPVSVHYVDGYGKLQVLTASEGYDANASRVLGEHYFRRFAGYFAEGVFKTLASFVPAAKGAGFIANAGRVALKLSLKN
jgi:hypothetical protein